MLLETPPVEGIEFWTRYLDRGLDGTSWESYGFPAKSAKTPEHRKLLKGSAAAFNAEQREFEVTISQGRPEEARGWQGISGAPVLAQVTALGGWSLVGVLTGAWENFQTRAGTRDVALQRPNPLGLYDMLGNVYEWCFDWWTESYSDEVAIDPQGPETGSSRVVRGGSWTSDAQGVRAAYRLWVLPGFRGSDLGFRLARGQGCGAPDAEPGS